MLLVLICKYCCCKLLCVCNITSYLCCMCMYVREHVCRPSLLCNPVIDKIDNNNNNTFIKSVFSPRDVHISTLKIMERLFIT